MSRIRIEITELADLLEAVFGLPHVSKPSAAAAIFDLALRFQKWVELATFFDGHGIFDGVIRGGLGLSPIRFAPVNDEEAIRSIRCRSL